GGSCLRRQSREAGASEQGYQSAPREAYIARDGVIYGEDVLTDFQLSVSELFARADQQRPAKE
ncbi:MAG TPA: hypothetical protein PLY87_20740, partial [Planctomycetaceae bacterium]|nr:hypothetical protein [Planctomycetaceae bacterium]